MAESCPGCGSTKTRKIKDKTYYLSRCSSCGLVFHDSRGKISEPEWMRNII